MTKTELLEQILAELKAIHALLDAPADLPTPADDYEGMAALLRGEPIDLDVAVAELQKIAGAY